jgi:hypothetical protein
VASLQIDGSFISDLSRGLTDLQLEKAMVAAHRLDEQAIAGFVKDGQMARLCHFGAGFTQDCHASGPRPLRAPLDPLREATT